MKKEVLFLVIFALLGVAFGCGVYFNSKDEASHALTFFVYDALASALTFLAFEGIATVCTNGKKFAIVNVATGVITSLLAVGLCLIG